MPGPKALTKREKPRLTRGEKGADLSRSGDILTLGGPARRADVKNFLNDLDFLGGLRPLA
jgi:hypothetical protein